MTIEWPLSAVHDVMADAVGDRPMLVWEDVCRTYAEVAERTKALAGYLVSHEVGLERDRDQLERWECGQAPVAIVMHNRPEYVEAMLGAYRARAVPFNVNHQYTAGEVGSLLDLVGVGAVVYGRGFGPLVAEALAGRPVVLIEVDDGSDVESLPGSTPYEQALEAGRGLELPTSSGDDLYLVCTGGTTGAPKGVLWRQADIFVNGMSGTDDATAESLAAKATTGEPEVWFAAPPLMHAAAQWTIFSILHQGGTAVLHDDSCRFDAAAILRTAEREHVTLMSIVGDAYARPLIDELRAGDYDLSSFKRLGTGGAMTATQYKEAFVELVPDLLVVDGYGASETGGMAFGLTSRKLRTEGLSPTAGGLVLSADRTRVLEPGDDEVGWIARRGRVPLGYLNDRAATEATFPIVDGERLAVPGDRGQLNEDGSVRLLGRDSMVVNTGGEKVFVEEVEQALLRHPDVADVLVVGRPSERYGEEVTAVVQLRPGAQVTGAELRERAAEELARYKAPRAVAVVDQVKRHPTGKADYRWAKQAALAAEPVVARG